LKRRRAVAGLVLAAALGGGCARSVTSRLNLVVVLVDTLRADHLALYGYRRETSPRLDAWAAREGVVFDDARAQAPCTFPSVNSILTSRSPGLFLARASERELGIPAGMPTLATVLAADGYTTAAVSASPIVRATPSGENPGAGFGAGFASFDELCFWREAGCVSARARQRLRKLTSPFFLYVHYMDPHDPYRLPQGVELPGRFAGSGPAGAHREFVRAGDPRPLEAFLYHGGPDPHVAPAELAHWIDLYDDEILYWDRELAPFIGELRRRAGPHTVIAVVADHGEEFMEHGSIKHCHTLFDTEIHVPIVLFVPGAAARHVALPVANLDLAPTLLGLLGILPPASFEGRDLAPLVRSGVPPPRAATFAQLSTFGELWSVAGGGYKLIADQARGSFRSFDLRRDPAELSPLAAVPPERFEALRRTLALWRRLNDESASEAGTRALEKQLRAVGYLQ
jgi:arylsulfatase A-like enzyme